jgi:hypothetical protein
MLLPHCTGLTITSVCVKVLWEEARTWNWALPFLQLAFAVLGASESKCRAEASGARLEV